MRLSPFAWGICAGFSHRKFVFGHDSLSEQIRFWLGIEVTHDSHQAFLSAALSDDEIRDNPLDAEPIVNDDGERKHDCEMKTATRLREFYPTMGPVILGDALYANGPMLRQIAECEHEFQWCSSAPRRSGTVSSAPSTGSPPNTCAGSTVGLHALGARWRIENEAFNVFKNLGMNVRQH